MLSAIGKNITFKYEGQTEEVLKDVSFSITPHSSIGLIGSNGAGKSTLFNILLGHLKPASGMLTLTSNIRVGYLSQSLEYDIGMSVYDYLWRANPELCQLKAKIESLDENSPESDWLIVDDFEVAGGYGFEAKIKKNAEMLSLDSLVLSQPINTLSGGEKTKVGILGLLINQPELLLLDEPTNHLDTAALNWFQKFLASTAIPYIVVSHDRRVLTQSVSEIWELQDGNLSVYGGNYDFYKNATEQERNRQMESFEQSQAKVKQLRVAARKRRTDANKMENFKESRSIKNNGGICKRDEGSASASANPNKKMRSAKALEGRILAVIESEEAKKPFIKKERKITLPVSSPCMSRTVVSIEGLGLTYGQNVIIDNLSIDISRGERLAVVGSNGSGKTSFLRSLTGGIVDISGVINWSPTAAISFFQQDNIDLNLENSILNEVWQPDFTEQSLVRIVLGSLGLEKDIVHQLISTLSPGEKVKVALAKAILSGANILILDEPTNHLEIKAREMLEEALLSYKGTLVFVSHDLSFVKAIATQVLDLSQGEFFDDPISWDT